MMLLSFGNWTMNPVTTPKMMTQTITLMKMTRKNQFISKISSGRFWKAMPN